MSLNREPGFTGHNGWLALVAMGVAILAGVQLVSGTAPLLWLLLACGALWALLAQASRSDDPRSIRVHSGHPRRRLGRR